MPEIIYVIDGDHFSTLDEFFEEITAVLTPGVHWGKNLDAFSDILRGGFATAEEGFIMIWKNSSRSRQLFGYEATIASLEKRVNRNLTQAQMKQRDYDILKKLYPNADESWLQQKLEHYQGGYLDASKRLALARQGQGDTIFDWLVAAIQQFPEIELRLE